MRKIVLIILGLLISEWAGAYSFTDWPSSKSGIEAAKPIVSKIKDFKAESGAYPKMLSDLKLTQEEQKSLQRYEYKYAVLESQQEFSISFNPSGPVYNCLYSEPVEFNVHKHEGWLCTGT